MRAQRNYMHKVMLQKTTKFLAKLAFMSITSDLAKPKPGYLSY